MRFEHLLPFTVLLLASACVVSSPGASRPCKNGTCASGYQCIDNACVLVDSAGPKGDPGPAGPQGPPGAGWTLSGNDLLTTSAGNVGIGTHGAPNATLDVNGTLHAEQDLSLLPEQSCHSIYLDNPNAGDLGLQLAPPVSQFGCIIVTLKANTTWTWNTLVHTAPFQYLQIVGEGFTNGAQNISVTITMTADRTWLYYGNNYRDPGRVSIGNNSYFGIYGVTIVENANDTRPLIPDPYTGGALFGTSGIGAIINLSQLYINSSEDVVGIGSRAFANITFGHTFINMVSGSPRNIFATKSYTGWAFGGGFGIVHNTHTTLGTGVTFQTTYKLTYTNI